MDSLLSKMLQMKGLMVRDMKLVCYAILPIQTLLVAAQLDYFFLLLALLCHGHLPS